MYGSRSSLHYNNPICKAQFSSVAQTFQALCDPMICVCQAFLSITNTWSSFKLMSINSVIPSENLILCHPLLLLPLIFPSGSFLMSQLFATGGQSFGASASASVLPMNIQGWFPLGLTDFISFQFKGLSRVSSITTVQKHQFFSAQLSLWYNSHIHTWLLEKPQLLLDGHLMAK